MALHAIFLWYEEGMQLSICAVHVPGQAWQRQVQELGRQLSKAAADAQDAERERASLLDSLRAAEQVPSFPAAAAAENHAWAGRCLECLAYILVSV
jgi:hypothetical protein